MLTVVCLVSLPVNGRLKRREKGCNGTPTRVKTLILLRIMMLRVKGARLNRFRTDRKTLGFLVFFVREGRDFCDCENGSNPMEI